MTCHRILVATVALATALITVEFGCAARPAVLVGQGGHHRQTARAPGGEVTIVLTTRAWGALPSDLEQQLAVLHVLVVNNGDEPIRLAPSDISFKDRRGFQYDLLDPGVSFYSVDSPQQPGYGRAYDEDYDPGMGDQDHLRAFAALDDVAALALPWGVLGPRTQMRGYLYFEPITAHANGGELRWRLHTSQDKLIYEAVFKLAVARRAP